MREINNKPIRNEKSTIKTIMATSIIVTLFIAPTSLNETRGLTQTISQSMASTSHMPPSAQKLQIYLNHQVATHKGWIGHLFWNATGGHIMYLGPYSKDPFKVPGSELGNICCQPFPPQGSKIILANSLVNLVDFLSSPILYLNKTLHFSS